MVSRTPLIYCDIDKNSEAGHDALPLSISKRPIEVLGLTAQGLSGPEIGAALGISKQTVRHHLQRARRALDAKTTTEAAVKAARLNII